MPAKFTSWCFLKIVGDDDFKAASRETEVIFCFAKLYLLIGKLYCLRRLYLPCGVGDDALGVPRNGSEIANGCEIYLAASCVIHTRLYEP